LGALSKAVDPDVPSEPPSKKIILVTGGCGFLGSTCVEMLVEQGDYDEVRVFDIVKGHVVDHPKVKFVQGDLTKLDDCLRVVDGCSAILHMGAIVDMRYCLPRNHILYYMF
jgi:nucleoside-diphosphate-sugar epimerase